MKNVGILILAIGVALSAAYGARLSPAMRAQMVLRGEAQLRGQAEEAAKGTYCEALIGLLDGADGARARALAEADGCALPDATAEEETSGRVDVAAICAARGADGGTEEDVVRAGREALEARRAEDAPSAVTSARAAWLSAMEASIVPAARAAILQPITPERRLEEWFSESGPLFLLGILLVVVGAVLGRVAVKREASAADSEKSETDARDLAELLEELRGAVAGLAEEAAGIEEPKAADFTRLKDEIHEIQLEKFEPIVGSAPRVQARYGMGAFAEVFGPLSSAERYLNRSWAALVDEHWPEAEHSLSRSAKDLQESLTILEGHAKENS